MLRSIFTASAALALLLSQAFASSVPSPPLYPSFATPRSHATFTTFDPRRSTGTEVSGINANGAIAGWFYGHYSSDSAHGFVRAADGTIKKFDAPGYGADTIVTGINDSGAITGYKSDGAGVGFVRAADGTITTFDAPGASTANGGTLPNFINSKGVIVGTYEDNSGVFRGFARDINGRFTVIAVDGSNSTVATSINAAGTIAGHYADGSNILHGFVRAPDGPITTFDPSGSTQTIPNSINAAGAVAGYYTDGSGLNHGFVRAPDGTITTFLVGGPGIRSGWSTIVLCINDQGVITGEYSNGALHGFVRSSGGTITKFDAPGAGTGQNEGTLVAGINDKGVIAGTADSGSMQHGFVRSRPHS